MKIWPLAVKPDRIKKDDLKKAAILISLLFYSSFLLNDY